MKEHAISPGMSVDTAEVPATAEVAIQDQSKLASFALNAVISALHPIDSLRYARIRIHDAMTELGAGLGIDY